MLPDDAGVDSTPPAWLLGRWRFLRADAELDFAPSVRMEFLPGGRLNYTLDVGGRDQVVPLIYQVRGDTLRTDNPTAPHATATRFHRGEGGVLVFDFSGAQAWFIREEPIEIGR